MPTAASLLNVPQDSSLKQTRILLWGGFGGLLLLMGVLGLSSISFLYQIEIRQEKIRQDYVERDRTLEKLRSAIYLSGTYFRDFLLDTSDALAAHHKSQFLEARRKIEDGIQEYRHLLRPAEREEFQQLSAELTAYFNTLTPALEWTAQQRRLRGYAFIEEEVLPRRMMAIGLADRSSAPWNTNRSAGRSRSIHRRSFRPSPIRRIRSAACSLAVESIRISTSERMCRTHSGSTTWWTRFHLPPERIRSSSAWITGALQR